MSGVEILRRSHVEAGGALNIEMHTPDSGAPGASVLHKIFFPMEGDHQISVFIGIERIVAWAEHPGYIGHDWSVVFHPAIRIQKVASQRCR